MPLYKLKIKTISPIHIGDGGVYDGMTLLPVDSKFIPLNFPLIFKVFKKHNISLEKFKSWLLDKKNERQYRKPSIDEFLQNNYRSSYTNVKNSFIELSSFELENLSTTRISSDINTCLKDMDHRPYISGSEIKGAIITALLFSWLRPDNHFYEDLKATLTKNKLVLDYIYDSMVKTKKLTQGKKSAGHRNFKEMDIPQKNWAEVRSILTMRADKPISQIERELKATQNYSNQKITEITDLITEWREGEKVRYNDLLSEEKKKYNRYKIKGILDQISALEETYTTKYLMSSDEKKGTGNHKLMRFLQISDSNPIDESKISSCLIVHQDPRITMNLFYEIIDSNYYTSTICRINYGTPNCVNYLRFDKEILQVINKERILQAIYQFSRAIIASDQAYFNFFEGGYRFPVREVKEHLAELEKLNQPTSPLLRIGKGQGFLSLTMALLLQEYDLKHHTEIYNKLIGVVQSNKNDPQNYPITRRLVADSDQKLKLPGWIKLNMEEINQ